MQGYAALEELTLKVRLWFRDGTTATVERAVGFPSARGYIETFYLFRDPYGEFVIE